MPHPWSCVRAKKIQHRFARRCGIRFRARKKDSLVQNQGLQAHVKADLRSPAKKKRFQSIARSRMTSASGFRLGRPRAVAHGWGKGARILTETLRIPQSRLQKLKNNALAAENDPPGSSFGQWPLQFPTLPFGYFHCFRRCLRPICFIFGDGAAVARWGARRPPAHAMLAFRMVQMAVASPVRFSARKGEKAGSCHPETHAGGSEWRR